MTRQSRQHVVLACVTVSSTAASVLSFAGILAGRLLYLVGLALDTPVLFPARTALGLTSG